MTGVVQRVERKADGAGLIKEPLSEPHHDDDMNTRGDGTCDDTAQAAAGALDKGPGNIGPEGAGGKLRRGAHSRGCIDDNHDRAQA